ncbi:MAG TPA: DUF6600 domain-containing protein [Thermoanaerobaculia bacterium]
MSPRKFLVMAAAMALVLAPRMLAQSAPPSSDARSAYTYVREVDGSVAVVSEANGSVDARRNLPISVGDMLSTEDPARAEIAMADGNLLQVGGGTQIKFLSLSGQQGSDDQVSAIDLTEGSVILSVIGSDDRAVPRIDTDDATVYASLGSRVRVNADPRHGSSVIVRAGSVEVRSRTGSYTVRAGNYLTVNGDEEPEIARGDFSRDRFDGWAADRMESYSESSRTASSKYVGEDYAGDVQALDGYGDWQYNDDYGSEVWRPNVAVGWSPYSNGSWYYTPIGLTWWSWDPWGWFPFHYGNWFWDVGWNSWCWSPGYVYSPAWCYYGYSGGYFGWCPTGWYGGYSPWWNSYYKNWGYPRAGVQFAINGRFATRNVALRGWNFTNTNNVGSRGRLDVVNGTRAVDRLGSDFSISSRPIVVQARGTGNVRDAVREQIREAPRTIERTAGDSSRLAPVVARDAKLPAASVDALRERAVVADRGRLSGPGARDIAPRGATIVERGDSRGLESSRTDAVRRDDRGGRNLITNRGTGASPAAPDRSERPEISRQPSRPDSAESWRSRPEAPRSADAGRGTVQRSPEPRENRPTNPSNQERADAWRQSNRPAPNGNGTRSATPREGPVQRGTQSWRSRSDVPPARRVIEGAVPNRRTTESPRHSDAWRQAPPPSRDSGSGSRNREVAPPRRSFDDPRAYTPRSRPEAPPQYRSAPPSRDFSPSSPPSRDFAPRPAPAPPSRSFDRAPSAPSAPPRSAPSFSSPRSSPPSHGNGRPGRN